MLTGVLGAMVVASCGPNGAQRIALNTAAQPTPTAAPAPRPPTPINAVAQRPAAAGTVAPTPAVTIDPKLRPPTPTPKPMPVCQFDSHSISVPLLNPTPGAVPTTNPWAGVSGWRMATSTAPLPGVVLELRLPSTPLIAGALIGAQALVRSNSQADIQVMSYGWVVPPMQDLQQVESDPRTFNQAIPRPAPIPRTLHPGEEQTWDSVVQLPFNAATPFALHAGAMFPALNTAQRGIAETPDIPLSLQPATSAQHLRLDVKADRRQWCLHATDASGNTPIGPLRVGISALNQNRGGTIGSVNGGTGDMWADYWDDNILRGDTAIDLKLWVGGPNYESVMVETGVATAP